LEEETTTTSVDTPKKKPPQPTRFDRLKQLYKGPRFTVSDEEIPFTYDDFAQAVDATEYGFERNAVVEGVAVEYSSSGCLVDIGAKASAFLPEAEASLMMHDKVLMFRAQSPCL
jgi:hypothetical protein